MKVLLAALGIFFACGCAHVGKKEAGVSSQLVGIYEGRHVIDTEERITLRQDRTFSYDFIPFLREGGASYRGRWKLDGKDLILIASLESGADEQFRLQVTFQGEEPRLTYTWAASESQRAMMLIPNVFVRTEKASAYGPMAPEKTEPNRVAGGN
ncbi:MAG: hypothetical protein ABIR80_16360 [Opitutaceae bacterium]